MRAIGPSNLWKKRLGDWVINPYVGCEHGCVFCYCPAMPGVKFHNGHRPQEEWGKYLLPKQGFVEAVAREVKRFTPAKARTTAWGDGWILASFLTDCYTPTEAKLKITRESLKLILEAGHKVRLQTRSALVERDFDLLQAHRDRVLVGTSLPYLNDRLARVLEPKASSPSRRLKMLQRARDAGLEVYVAIAPVMPFQTESDLEEIFATVLPLEPREIFCEVLNPKGSNLEMTVAALQSFDAQLASHMADYKESTWAPFTEAVMRQGVARSNRFVAWPDTGRAWKKHLNADSIAFLEQFLPHALN